jgi:hypothetical protein
LFLRDRGKSEEKVEGRVGVESKLKSEEDIKGV